MVLFRRLLPWMAALSLVLQIGLGGVSLSAMAPAEAPASTLCTCFHGADHHGECPMHHTASGQTRCRVRGLDDAATTALAALLAPLTTPSAAPADFVAPSTAAASQSVLALPIARPFVPDLPPPRS